MTKPLSVLIADGEDEDLPLKVLRCLGQVPDLDINVLSSGKWSPARFSRYRKEFINHPEDVDEAKQFEIVLETAKKTGADVILGIYEPTVRMLAHHRDLISTVSSIPPSVSTELFDNVTDKWLFSRILEKGNIPFPFTLKYQGKPLDPVEISKLIFPVLAKPTKSVSGIGIRFFQDQSVLNNFLADLGNQDSFIIQSFIKGFDVGCSVLCREGRILAFTMQRGIIPGKKRFEPASVINIIYNEEVYFLIEKLMKLLNWSGIANIDLRYDEEEKNYKILEINPRFWGSIIGSLAAGINFPYLSCLAALNQSFPVPEYQKIYYAKPEITVKLFIKKFFSNDHSLPDRYKTGLPYSITDPLPEFNKQLQRFLMKRFKINIFTE